MLSVVASMSVVCSCHAFTFVDHTTWWGFRRGKRSTIRPIHRVNLKKMVQKICLDKLNSSIQYIFLSRDHFSVTAIQLHTSTVLVSSVCESLVSC